MGYGYNRKTCSYCRQNHAILDCKKLQTDAADAVLKLAEWDKKHKAIHDKSALYSELYIYTRLEPDANGVTKYVYNKTEKEYAKRRVSYRFHSEYEWDYDSMPDQIEYEEYCEITKHRHESKRHFQMVVEKNEKVRAKADARSKKACSYCREAGHTVRTCSQLKKDAVLHRQAHMISSYKYAKALARFGVWTGAMVVTSKHPMPRMANTQNFSTSPLMVHKSIQTSYGRQPDGEYRRKTAEEMCKEVGISVEDLHDFLYLKSAFDGGIRFQSVSAEEGYYSGSHYRIYGTAEICFKTNPVKPEE